MALSLLAKLDYLKKFPWNGATKLAQLNLRACAIEYWQWLDSLSSILPWSI